MPDARAPHPRDALAFDRSSVRSYDADGRLHVALTPISKAAVNPYYGYEIPGSEALGLEPTRVYQLLRDPDELAKAAETSNNIPLMQKHIRQAPDDPQQMEIVGSTGTDAVFEAPYLKNSLVVWVKSAIRDIENSDKRELSCSYHYEPDMTPGEYQGQPHDGVMRNIRFNHVAQVEDGRAGSDVLVEDSLPITLKDKPMKISRKALAAHGALVTYLRPKLAQDAKLPDLRAALLGTTAATWATQKPVVAARVIAAAQGRLAKDADLKDIHGLLDSLDDTGDGEPDEMDVMDRAKDESPEEKEAREKREKEAKDKAARDKRARDADPLEKVFQFLDGKIDADLMEGLRELMKGDRARDEAPEEKEARERMERECAEKEAKDNRAAMDSAIAAGIAAERQRQAAIRDAERDVRPYIGELTMAQDSAESVYRLALDAMGVDLKDVHPSAFRALLTKLPKPGRETPRMAHDAAQAKSFADRFPEATRIRSI